MALKLEDLPIMIDRWRQFAGELPLQASRFTRLADQLESMWHAGHCTLSTPPKVINLLVMRAKHEKQQQELEREALPERVCAACGDLKALNQFAPAKRQPDGYNPRCRSCVKRRITCQPA